MSENMIELHRDVQVCFSKIYDLQYRADAAEAEVNRLVEKVASLEEENRLLRDRDRVDMRAMVSDKLDFAIRDIRNAVLDGSLGDMTEEEFNAFVSMIANGDILPF